MGFKFMHALTTALALWIIEASGVTPICPNDPNCVCRGTFAIELNCNIDGRAVYINILPNTFLNIKCENVTSLEYNKLPKYESNNKFKSVTFKDCPLPETSFREVLTNLGVSNTMALIFQNAKKLSENFDRKHFAGLQDLTKLLLSVNGVTRLPDNLFQDLNNLIWLNIKSNTISLSEELFKPLKKLEILEISHNHMTNITSNVFSHLSYLRKLSLWQSDVTWFSEDFFTGVDVLEELDLSSNGLNELPAPIFKPLRKLKKLTLFSNKFSSLPQNLFKSNDELETVIILNNDVKLKSLPKYLFGNMKSLKEAYVQRSGIEEVTSDLFANSPLITNISLAFNDIQVLPELIFNDQINLLELDLSYNQLNKLESKLFSSLVRLEKLNLCHNNLLEISGLTFSPLLSLIYLNMENNKIETISDNFLSNNKQKMEIYLAYNNLTFERKELKNNAWVVEKSSPFARTYNLRLLNLSHNQFKITFDDWWINGHDILDISYNSIENLWYKDQNNESTIHQDYKILIRKPIQQLWMAHNPVQCKCNNFKFLDFLHENLKTMVMDKSQLECPAWAEEVCHFRFIILISLITVSVSLSTVIVILYFVYRKQVNMLIKHRFHSFYCKNNVTAGEYSIEVKYSEKDEEFVLKEVLPGLKCHKNLNVFASPTDKDHKFTLANKFKGNQHQTVVIFSTNYLASAYSHVNIKRIHGEMAKMKNTLYVFVDIGPEDSIYAFLKDQRDRRITVLWSEPNFWNNFLSMLAAKNKRNRHEIHVKKHKRSKPSLGNNSITKQPEWSTFYLLDSLHQSQV